jgi:hypothetical protein
LETIFVDTALKKCICNHNRCNEIAMHFRCGPSYNSKPKLSHNWGVRIWLIVLLSNRLCYFHSCSKP